MTDGPTSSPDRSESRGRRRRRRWWVWGAAGAALLLILLVAFRPERVRIDAAAVTRGPMAAWIQDRGQTRAVDRYVLSSPVAGTLERIPLRAGDSVRAGEVVARIAPSSLNAIGGAQARAAAAEAEAGLRRARASAAAAEARAELAASESRRQEELALQGIASQRELDVAQANRDTAQREARAAQAAVGEAEAGVTAARSALLALHPTAEGTIELRAPVDSRIFAIAERSGRAIAPGEPIMTLGNPHQIEAVIDLLSEDAVRVAVGDPAELVDWGGDQPLPGSVQTVEASAFTKVSALGIEEQRVHVIVSIPDPPPDLGDGYRVQGRIEVWSSENAVQIPIGALTRLGARWGTYVVVDGRARQRAIEIGHRNDEVAEVLSGLQGGERVILHPTDEVADGARVAE